MSNVTTQQLAELLLGIARAQNAIIDAMENSNKGFKSGHFRPTLETTSRIRSNQPDTLVDFPARLLLQMLGRTGPDVATVTKNLDLLLGQGAPAEKGAADSLDMT